MVRSIRSASGRVVDYLFDNGVTGLSILGSTGEGPALTNAQRAKQRWRRRWRRRRGVVRSSPGRRAVSSPRSSPGLRAAAGSGGGGRARTAAVLLPTRIGRDRRLFRAHRRGQHPPDHPLQHPEHDQAATPAGGGRAARRTPEHHGAEGFGAAISAISRPSRASPPSTTASPSTLARTNSSPPRSSWAVTA